MIEDKDIPFSLQEDRKSDCGAINLKQKLLNSIKKNNKTDKN
jgi:hypothetical protein